MPQSRAVARFERLTIAQCSRTAASQSVEVSGAHARLTIRLPRSVSLGAAPRRGSRHPALEHAAAVADRLRHDHRGRARARPASTSARCAIDWASLARRCAKRFACWPRMAWSSSTPIAARRSFACPRRTSATASSSWARWRRFRRARVRPHHRQELVEIKALTFQMLACHARRDLPAYYHLNRHDPRPTQPRGGQCHAGADLRHAQPAHPEPALPLELRRRQVGAAPRANTSAWWRRSKRATASTLAALLRDHLRAQGRRGAGGHARCECRHRPPDGRGR